MHDAQKLQREIQKKSLARLGPLFDKYRIDPESMESVIKWKSIVLVLGNFSSGKSTLLNELFSADIQRTGQAPTDDSFTILTAPSPGDTLQDIPGSTLINDERLPFSALKRHGEQFSAHFHMKMVDSPQLENLAIIDTPGMIDAITEKDRGYDYARVVGDLAALADLVVMMFDPHKAGTIGEVYDTIRNTLPKNAGEDRVIYVLSRIDECDNPTDLVRSYGTVCWNLSQMTGRKDIPRIFMIYSPALAGSSDKMVPWDNDRTELKDKILGAPKLRISHILQNVERQAQELRMISEAMTAFSARGRRLMLKTGKVSIWLGFFMFLFLDNILKILTGFPETTMITALAGGSAGLTDLLIPGLGVGTVVLLASLYFSRWQLPRLIKKTVEFPDDLLNLDSDYRSQLWKKVRPSVINSLSVSGIKDIVFSHHKFTNRVDRFLELVIQNYYQKAAKSAGKRA